jgi:DNA polymerase-4
MMRLPITAHLLILMLVLLDGAGASAVEQTLATTREPIGQVLIVADEIPAMQVLAGRLKAEEGIESRIVKQGEMPEELSSCPAVIVYIHKNLAEATERALIQYATGGGRLILLHHSISSAKRKNKEWFKFLGVRLSTGDVQEGGYQWAEGVTMTIVVLKPEHFITTHKVNWPERVDWNPPGATASEQHSAVTLTETEVYYAEVSRLIHEIFERFTPLVEPLSLDEAFLDVTGSQGLFGPAPEIGRKIKQAIRKELCLVASVGVAPSKFVAKIASDLKKPDGFVVVEPERVQEFLDPLPVERLWGVGRQGSKVFEKMGIRTIGQLRQWPLETLKDCFGSSGEHLWQLAHGKDDRRVIPERDAKSISHETTFERDVGDLEVLRACLLELTEQVGGRLRRLGLRGMTVNLKVRFAEFSLITRSQTLPEPTNITQELWQAAEAILCHRLPAGHLPVRLLGMGVSGFDESGLIQGMLFDREERQKQARLDNVADQIKERFGTAAIRRGSSLGGDGHHPAR